MLGLPPLNEPGSPAIVPVQGDLLAPEQGWLIAYAIITTDANDVMAAVHNRRPVIPSVLTRPMDLAPRGTADALGPATALDAQKMGLFR